MFLVGFFGYLIFSRMRVILNSNVNRQEVSSNLKILEWREQRVEIKMGGMG